jgi:homoserine O-acetyltransferase
MRHGRLLVLMLCVPLPVLGQALTESSLAGDFRKFATESDYIVRDFRFHTGEILPELHLHYATWGTPRRNAAGEITNAALLLHGTLGTGISFGAPAQVGPNDVHPLFSPGKALDIQEYYVIAPDTIGSGKTSRPSDGLRMKFPRYNLEDIVAAERLVIEHLGVKHLVVVSGIAMGGRQTWQWGVQYPDFMDAIVPLICSPFPNAGRRGIQDYLPVAIIKADPEWNQGNYDKNPQGARLADIISTLFVVPPAWYTPRFPTRADAEKLVREGKGALNWPDANDLIYMLEVNDGFDAWSQLNRIRCQVLMINMAADPSVPVELHQAEQVLSRLKNASYVEVKEEADYGHMALRRTYTIWEPQLHAWLLKIRGAKQQE